MSRLAGQRALVTGASGGVGEALARRLAECGVDSVLLARREEPLEAVAAEVRSLGRRAEAVVGDVTNSDARRRALNTARDAFGGLDLVVNNAGIGAHGRFHEAEPERFRQLMEVNLFAAAELTREAIPLLSESPDACVANVGSVLGWRGVPYVAEYCASKFALRGWCEAVRPELAKLGIHVLHASPSTIKSQFRANLVERAENVPWGDRPGVTPERVARCVVRGVERRQNEVAIAWEDWGFVRAARLFPWAFNRIFKRWG